MLKKAFLAASATLITLIPSLPTLAQSALSAQDIDYLSMLHQVLLSDKNFNFSPLVDELASENKIALAKSACSVLSEGGTFSQMTDYLYSPSASELVPDMDEQLLPIWRKYVFAAWFVGVKSYCPQYDYQLESK